MLRFFKYCELGPSRIVLQNSAVSYCDFLATFPGGACFLRDMVCFWHPIVFAKYAHFLTRHRAFHFYATTLQIVNNVFFSFGGFLISVKWQLNVS